MGLCGPPTEAPCSKQQMGEKGKHPRQDITRDCCLSQSLLLTTAKPENFNKQRIVRSTNHAMDEANLPLKRLIALATSVCVCVCVHISS